MGGSTSISLNTIPMAAVERVEVNLDGGSAIYGSDAIGGVINVVSKGLRRAGLPGPHRLPTEEGGDEKSGSIVAGWPARGRPDGGLRARQKDVIYSRDRDYLAKQGNGIFPSPYGRNVGGSRVLTPTATPIWKYGLWRATNADGSAGALRRLRKAAL